MILFALFSLFHPSQLLVVCKINPIYECSNSYLTGLGNMLTDIIADETYHRPLPIEGGMNGVELFKQFHLQLSFVSFLISFFFVSEASHYSRTKGVLFLALKKAKDGLFVLWQVFEQALKAPLRCVNLEHESDYGPTTIYHKTTTTI